MLINVGQSVTKILSKKQEVAVYILINGYVFEWGLYENTHMSRSRSQIL